MKTLMKAAGTGTSGAVVFVIAVWFVADAASGPILADNPDGDLAEVRLAGAIIATIIGGILGTGLAFLLRGRARGERRFLNICGALLIVYGAWAFSQAEDLVTGIWLNVMHLAAAAPIIDQLRRWLRTT